MKAMGANPGAAPPLLRLRQKFRHRARVQRQQHSAAAQRGDPEEIATIHECRCHRSFLSPGCKYSPTRYRLGAVLAADCAGRVTALEAIAAAR